MNQISLRWAQAVRQLSLWAPLMVALLGLLPQSARASHIRADDIQARVDTTGVNPRRVFFKLTLYTDILNTSVVEDEVTIFFGDGTAQEHIRRTTLSAVPIASSPDTGLNIYLFEHIFPSASSFTISYIGENRNDGIRNMSDSRNQSFYISTTIRIDPLLGLNHTPVLNAPAFDKAAVGQVFLHNPAASDADGDSLAFRPIVCQQVPLGVQGTLISGGGNNNPAPAPCPNYRYPNDPAISGAGNPVQVSYNGVPTGQAGQAAIYDINAVTGQITWNAPVLAGFYNVAFVVEEWRRSASGSIRKIGEVIRDMQIIVRPTQNLRPEITIPADLCVVAGQTVRGTVTATDGSGSGAQAPTPVSLFAYGGMLPPARFTQTAAGPPQAQGEFVWTPDCADIAQLPHQVVFKAQDNPTSATDPSLIDERVWRITVVGPPPQNVQATAAVSNNLNTAQLSWDRYQCQNASVLYIYRREGAAGTTPGPCETGIPANSGYVRIASVAPTATTYTDSNPDASGVARGLDRGKTYCYRIYAEFPMPAGGESLASAEACLAFTGRPAVLTNVDVNQTSSTTGQITVRWTMPKTGNTTTFRAPLGYRVLRSSSAAPSNFVLARTFTSLTDTVLVDTSLNTEDLQYTYKLEFFSASTSGSELLETSAPATSIRTSAVPNGLDKTITVTWAYQVPWDNTGQPAVIYRRSATGSYVRIGTAPTTATGGSYLDNDASLQKLETYCYYVETTGQYAAIAYLNALVNKSQERCAVLTDTPCDPVLTLRPTNCDSLASLREFPAAGQRYSNYLSWTLGNTPAGCKAEAQYYRIYYRPASTEPYVLLDSTNQTNYTHAQLDFSGGCYRVQAVDVNGVRSGLSNEACQDNCVFFVLPNIFTPNGDGLNDTFRPKNSSPLRQVHFTVFNRWGVKVFENTTSASIFINWDGGGPSGESRSGAPRVSDGVYFYQAVVDFADNNNTQRTYKGWVELLR